MWNGNGLYIQSYARGPSPFCCTCTARHDQAPIRNFLKGVRPTSSERFLIDPLMNNQSTQSRINSPWMTTAEVSEYLSVSAGTVRNWVSQRTIPFARRGRVVRFHKDRIDQWLFAGACRGRRSLADGATGRESSRSGRKESAR